MAFSGEQPATIVHYCSYNAQQDLVACATSNGFMIYKSDPFRERLQRDVSGGVSIVELLDKTNLIVIVPIARPTCLQLWDDAKRTVIVELEEENRDNITAVRIRRQNLICASMTQVSIYSLGLVPQLTRRFPTVANPNGLIAVSTTSSLVVAFPARKEGLIQVVNFGEQILHANADQMETCIIHAHSKTLQRLAVSADGSLIASASRSGTLIRLWSAGSGQQIREFRRGTEAASISCMTFSPFPGDLMLAVASETATIHIFNLCGDSDNLDVHENSTLLPRLSSVKNYLLSKRSSAQAHLPVFRHRSEQSVSNYKTGTLVGWCSAVSFFSLTPDGNYWKFLITAEVAGLKLGVCQLEARRSWGSP